MRGSTVPPRLNQHPVGPRVVTGTWASLCTLAAQDYSVRSSWVYVWVWRNIIGARQFARPGAPGSTLHQVKTSTCDPANEVVAWCACLLLVLLLPGRGLRLL